MDGYDELMLMDVESDGCSGEVEVSSVRQDLSTELQFLALPENNDSENKSESIWFECIFFK